MRHYELMVILDPNLDERTITPSLEAFLRVIRGDGGTVEKVDVWGKRRMSYEILKHAEGIYAVLDVTCEPATVAELDRQLSLNESVLRTKVMRVETRKRAAARAARAAAPGGPANVAAAPAAAAPSDAPASAPASDGPDAPASASAAPAVPAPAAPAAPATPAEPAAPAATPAD
ncbi:MAG: small subunit ribosomal protein [Pseudonocardiales bacterium]|jgi:small subunit ribosomal protein S6|nr:small subunit ribosomal protein [Pseudonocardiales bacterium]MDT7632394.1 small subunit ribosomal protein [Pseudonocardiales bacterium]MDT7641252.1 small subunit ribosomal protein [Pseudonocardiales bacterium]MDT7676840.1 small subunit ribosomal protein [Pseudonocardiales bacterium]